MISACLISGHIDLGHVVEVVSARFFQYKVSIFPFAVNLILKCIQIPNH